MIYFWFSSQDLWLLWMPSRRKIADGGGGELKAATRRNMELASSKKAANSAWKSDRTTAPEWITIFHRGSKAAWVSKGILDVSNKVARKRFASIGDIDSHQLKVSRVCSHFSIAWMTIDITLTPLTRAKVLDEALNLICALRTTGCFNSRNVHLCFTGAV